MRPHVTCNNPEIQRPFQYPNALLKPLHGQMDHFIFACHAFMFDKVPKTV